MNAFSEDAQVMLMRVKRHVAAAPAQVADGVAKMVADTPDDRLEKVMRSPARRAVLEGIFWQMPRLVERRQAARVTATVRWSITGRGDGGADAYNLEIANGECRVTRGDTGVDPRLTVILDGAEFVRLATGNSDPMQAYFNGRMALAGDIMFAATLTTLFRFPKRSSASDSKG